MHERAKGWRDRREVGQVRRGRDDDPGSDRPQSGDSAGKCGCGLGRRDQPGEIVGAHHDQSKIRAERNRPTGLGRQITRFCARHREHPQVYVVAVAYQYLSKPGPDRLPDLLGAGPVGDRVTEDDKAQRTGDAHAVVNARGRPGMPVARTPDLAQVTLPVSRTDRRLPTQATRRASSPKATARITTKTATRPYPPSRRGSRNG